MNLPEAGDIHWADFGETLGTEQAGRRPALVISERAFNVRSPRLIVCPITSRHRDWPTVLAMPPESRTRGVILCDQLRSIDRQARMFAFIERLPQECLARVRNVVGEILGIASDIRA
jgi:mRNA interferase MazF